MAEKEPEAKESAEAAPAKKSKKKLIIAVVGVVFLVAVAGVASMTMMGGEPKEEGEHEKQEHVAAPVLKTAKLDTFIVNLSEVGAFLKVSLLLEYDQNIIDKLGGQGAGGGHGYGGGAAGGGAAADPLALPAAMKVREPMIRDAIIRVISSKRSIEVLSTDGKEKLKEEIIEVANEALGLEEAPVVNVYFLEFIIQ